MSVQLSLARCPCPAWSCFVLFPFYHSASVEKWKLEKRRLNYRKWRHVFIIPFIRPWWNFKKYLKIFFELVSKHSILAPMPKEPVFGDRRTKKKKIGIIWFRIKIFFLNLNSSKMPRRQLSKLWKFLKMPPGFKIVKLNFQNFSKPLKKADMATLNLGQQMILGSCLIGL